MTNDEKQERMESYKLNINWGRIRLPSVKDCAKDIIAKHDAGWTLTDKQVEAVGNICRRSNLGPRASYSPGLSASWTYSKGRAPF